MAILYYTLDRAKTTLRINGTAYPTEGYYKGTFDTSDDPGSTSWKGPWYDTAHTTLTSIIIENRIDVVYGNSLFYGLTKVTTITGLENIYGTLLSGFRMFSGLSALTTEIELPNINFISCASTEQMFASCSSPKITLDNAKIGNVSNMNQMFYGSSVKEISLLGCSTASVNDGYALFCNCTNLTSIYATSGKFTMAGVTDDTDMFANCVKLPNYDMTKVGKDMAISKDLGGYIDMMPIVMNHVKTRIQNKVDTAANWATYDPTPLKGEICIDSTSRRFKVGDGTHKYSELRYYGGGSGSIDVDNITIVQDSEGYISVPIDFDTILVNSEGFLHVSDHFSVVDETGRTIELFYDSEYKLTITLRDKNGNAISTAHSNTVADQLVTDVDYDASTKELVIMLRNGNVTRVPLVDLVDGLVKQTAFDKEVAERKAVDLTKQDKLTAGNGITITSNSEETIISSSGATFTDVDELPTSDINESTIYRVKGYTISTLGTLFGKYRPISGGIYDSTGKYILQLIVEESNCILSLDTPTGIISQPLYYGAARYMQTVAKYWDSALSGIMSDLPTDLADKTVQDLVEYDSDGDLIMYTSTAGYFSACNKTTWDAATIYKKTRYYAHYNNEWVELSASGGSNLTAGENITITSEGVISAKDTVYIAGENITITSEGIISSKDTTYTAGGNITITSDGIISARDTTYIAGENITITSEGIISSNATSTFINVISLPSEGEDTSIYRVKGGAKQISSLGVYNNAYDTCGWYPDSYDDHDICLVTSGDQNLALQIWPLDHSSYWWKQYAISATGTSKLWPSLDSLWGKPLSALIGDSCVSSGVVHVWPESLKSVIINQLFIEPADENNAEVYEYVTDDGEIKHTCRSFWKNSFIGPRPSTYHVYYNGEWVDLGDGKIKDVRVNDSSVVDSEGIANIELDDSYMHVTSEGKITVGGFLPLAEGGTVYGPIGVRDITSNTTNGKVYISAGNEAFSGGGTISLSSKNDNGTIELFTGCRSTDTPTDVLIKSNRVITVSNKDVLTGWNTHVDSSEGSEGADALSYITIDNKQYKVASGDYLPIAGGKMNGNIVLSSTKTSGNINALIVGEGNNTSSRVFIAGGSTSDGYVKGARMAINGDNCDDGSWWLMDSSYNELKSKQGVLQYGNADTSDYKDVLTSWNTYASINGSEGADQLKYITIDNKNYKLGGGYSITIDN